MRHSKTMKKTQKGRKQRTNVDKSKAKAKAPVTLEDLQRKEAPVDKDNLTTRMVSIRLVPQDAESATIRRNIQVLDNPTNILQVLRHRKAMEEAFQGNNITTGPTQYSFVRQFLTGESLRVFNEGATVAGNKTTANLTTALNHLVTFNCPREVLSKQTDYLKSKLYKPYDLTTRQYVGYYNNLNALCAQLPPAFDDTQKLSERELIINIASKAPKPHKKMLIQQGYNPENGSMADLIDYCERAETTENVEHGAKSSNRKAQPESSSSESDTGYIEQRSRRQKSIKKKDSRPKRDKKLDFYCRYHKENDSHDTADCKVLNNGDAKKVKRSGDWKDPKNREKKYKRELHLMQTKANRYKSKLAKLRMDSSSSEEEEEPRPRKQKRRVALSESESDSSSDEQSKYATPKEGTGQDHCSDSEESDSDDEE
jgi:hypothetical protein